MWCYRQKWCFYIGGYGSNTVINFWRETVQIPFSVLTKLNSKKVTTYFLQIWENKYCISSKKRARRFFNFEALKCGVYYRVELKRGRTLFRCKRNYSHEILKLCIFFSKLRYLSSLVYSRTTIFFLRFHYCILVPYAF